MQITVNGTSLEVEMGETLHDVQKRMNSQADIMIVNGFQTQDNRPLKEGDTIHIIERGAMPTKEQLESMMAARHTPQIQSKLKNAKVAIAGLGGLGSNIAVLLSRIGVGQLLLVDFDIVEPSNLNRQCYGIGHLNMYKTEALKQQLLEINPFNTVQIQTVKVTKDNVCQLFEGYDIVCEAFDNPQSKAMLVQTLLFELPQVQVVAASGMAGYESSNSIVTKRRMRNLYVCGDEVSEAREGWGLMAPRVTICAAHQANMVLRLIVGIQDV